MIVDLSDEMDELAIYTPKMIEDRVEVKKGDLLFLHTGWEKHAQFGSDPDEEKYIHRHPGAHPDMVPWLLEKEIHIWGVDCISTDHPMNLPIGRFLGKGMHGHCDRVRKQCEDKFGGPEGVAKLFPDSAYQLTHNALFPKNCMHIENLGGDIDRAGAAEQAADPRLLPVEVQRRRSGVLPRGGVHRRLEDRSSVRTVPTEQASTGARRELAAGDCSSPISPPRNCGADRRDVRSRSRRRVVSHGSSALQSRTLNAVVTLNPRAMDDARALDARLAAGEDPGLLCGLPVGIKDVTPVAGLRTTYGSPFTPTTCRTEDALVVRRLRDAGAVILGKTNCPEFAAGGNTFNEVFGRTRNPWNPAKSAGGSTGGGAAALASGMIALAEGTDLGGSLRIPASFCGVVGLRPSVGLVPTLSDRLGVGHAAGDRADGANRRRRRADAAGVAGPSDCSPLAQPAAGPRLRRRRRAGRARAGCGSRTARTSPASASIRTSSSRAASAALGADRASAPTVEDRRSRSLRGPAGVSGAARPVVRARRCSPRLDQAGSVRRRTSRNNVRAGPGVDDEGSGGGGRRSRPPLASVPRAVLRASITC